MRHFLLLLLLLLFTGSALQAQSLPPRYVWAGLSANSYRGDLEDGIPHYTPGVHIGLKLNRAKRLNGNFALGIGTLNGQDPNFNPVVEPPTKPNKYFSTPFFTLDYSLQYHLIKKERYLLYISQGVGLFRYNPKDEQDQALIDQGSTRPASDTYGNISLQLPTAIGGAYFLPNQWGIGLQASYLNPLTDFIDNISSLGSKSGNDHVLQFRVMLLVPLKASTATDAALH
jgi:hypothetical protein